jgi:hypothetical protein
MHTGGGERLRERVSGVQCDDTWTLGRISNAVLGSSKTMRVPVNVKIILFS